MKDSEGIECRTVAVGLIDREGCKGCVDEDKPLTDCMQDYVDKGSEAVCCDGYRDASQSEGTSC